MRRNRRLLWLWDIVFFRGAIGRQNWDREPVTYENGLQLGGKVSVWEKRYISFRPWWNWHVLRPTACRLLGHDWGWAREWRTDQVTLSRQSCARCWDSRLTPGGVVSGRLWIESNEAEIEQRAIDAVREVIGASASENQHLGKQE